MNSGTKNEKAAEDVETPEAFLQNLALSLAKQKDVDADLVGLLAKHVLSATPAVDAVGQAKAAILKLASERAQLPESELRNG